MAKEIDSEETFQSDEEVQQALDETLSALGEDIEYQETGVLMTDPRKMRNLMVVYKLLKYITTGRNLKITYAMNQPYKTMAYVSVNGKSVSFRNTGWFIAACKIASNVEFYPKTDGTVQVTFTFNGFARRID